MVSQLRSAGSRAAKGSHGPQQAKRDKQAPAASSVLPAADIQYAPCWACQKTMRT